MPLRINTAIPFANACDLQLAYDPNLAHVSFAADPHGGPESLWFCFRLEATGHEPVPPRTILCLKNPHNMLGGHQPEHMRPVLRYDGADWQRLGAPTLETLPDGRVQAFWTIDTPKTFADLAYCYPYGPDEVNALVADLAGKLHADVIGTSQGARPLVRLANAYGVPGSSRPGLYLVARQHAGETPGSWVMDGFLRHVAALGQSAPLVWAVPLSNMDGVMQGDYGKDNFPYDLNRAWGRPPMRYETLILQQDMRRWAGRCRPRAVLDFHAPGACENAGMYFFVPDPAHEPDAHAQTLHWTAAIREALTAEFAAENFERVGNYPSRWETPHLNTYARKELSVTALSLETPYALVGQRILTREAYRDAGTRLAIAVLKLAGQ